MVEILLLGLCDYGISITKRIFSFNVKAGCTFLIFMVRGPITLVCLYKTMMPASRVLCHQSKCTEYKSITGTPHM